MADISISLNNIQDVRTVDIKNNGVSLGALKIRRLGSGEDLDLSLKQRRINKLISDIESISNKVSKLNANDPNDNKKIEELLNKSDTIGGEIAEIKRLQFQIYKGLLSDDKKGELVDVIMNTLNDRERSEIFRMAFGDKNPIESPEISVIDGEEKNG